MVIAGNEGHAAGPRDIVLHRMDGKVVHITDQFSGYLALRYPMMLFPFADPNWMPGVPSTSGRRKNITQAEWYAGMLFERDNRFSPWHHAGPLFQEFTIDPFMCMNQPRLEYFRNHQTEIKAQLYQNVKKSIGDNTDASGTRIILPSSYIGSPRSMIQLYQDSMAIVGCFGRPSLFITMTASPAWREIKENLYRGQVSSDRPNLGVRDFNQKLKSLMSDLLEHDLLGKVAAHVLTVEFQKRGLPHAHIMSIMEPGSVLSTPEKIDAIVTAEVPDPVAEPVLHARVSNHMMHSLCNASTGCWEDGKCSKNFPKPYQDNTFLGDDSYPLYRRRPGGHTVTKSGRQLDNAWVIPYNKTLLLKYNCHINVEVPYGITATKYLFKYITKGGDRSEMKLTENDEIRKYINRRYLGPCEGLCPTLLEPGM
ncbi:hypothetical protein PCANC_17585 [Puccinia coronata f. sp. avenae]|uniref:Helitron helicase-like domain-containing protein n=1 Tax=Puccinia coronata f. sp. avenae TaxID=200324 RepID=A0A2N5VMZ1_9BASI|nr:hypothetical protein PCANC_17585 [Puccinia coronata f. sp. avenae]